jgi:hypothetical protein
MQPKTPATVWISRVLRYNGLSKHFLRLGVKYSGYLPDSVTRKRGIDNLSAAVSEAEGF